jgi:hypothetical protein
MKQLMHQLADLPRDKSRFVWLAIALGALAVVVAGSVVFTPSSVTLVGELSVAAVIVGVVRPRYVVAGLLVFLPFQDFVLSYVHGDLQIAVRYLPELIAVLLFVRVAASGGPAVTRRSMLFAAPLLLMIAYWLLTGLVASERLSTIAVGLRSELRFLPLLAVPLFSRRIERDALLYARAIVVIATVEAAIAVAEFAGGSVVRDLFTPRYSIVFDGVHYGETAPYRDNVVGTLAGKNLLGAFLVFGWIILVAAGHLRLGISRKLAFLSGALLVIGVVLSSSRQAMIGLIIAATLIAIIQRKKVQVIAVSLVAAAVVGLVVWVNVVNHPPAVPTSQQYNSWTYPLTPAAWKPNVGTNFRWYLLVAVAKQAAHTDMLSGYGIGAASDPRVIDNYSSPIYERFPQNKKTYIQGFLYDSNWATLVFEVGFAGVGLLLVMLATLFTMGLRCESGWPGLGLSILAVVTLVLGFYGPVLQARSTGAILWLFSGLAFGFLARTSPLEAETGATTGHAEAIRV